MDQEKIGKFIAESRRGQGLTQMQLAELLNITDRAVSKWERGKSLPDSSIMLPLCDILKISVNDLLNGEVVSMEGYDKKLEDSLIELVRQKEESDRYLLILELVIGILSTHGENNCINFYRGELVLWCREVCFSWCYFLLFQF